MKVEHNQALQSSELEGDELRERFRCAYNDYRKTREALQEENDETEERESHMVEARGAIAEVVLALYRGSDSLSGFEERLQDFVAYSGGVSLEELERYIVGSYIYPESLHGEQSHSPIEAIYATCENLKIITEFLEVGERQGTSILLSGTNAWGPFHAVKGKIPESLIDLGIEQRGTELVSDIDFLMTCATIDQLEGLVVDYIAAGLVPESEKARLSFFKAAHLSGATDVFSVRSHYRGVEESIHFVLEDTLEEISRGEEEKTDEGLGFVRDFRPNIPGNVRKHGGYPVGDLLGLEKKNFDPMLEPISEGDQKLGYLSRIPTGSFLEVGGQKTYFMGVLGFYLLVAPAVLSDPGGVLGRSIDRLRERVKNILGGALPNYIPREERMAPSVLRNVKESLAGTHAYAEKEKILP